MSDYNTRLFAALNWCSLQDALTLVDVDANALPVLTFENPVAYVYEEIPQNDI